MNTRPLSFRHPRILYREATGEREIVSAFVNACDAMLHARLDGETFGLAAAEFSLAGKPVLTFPSPTGQNHHLEALGEKALIWRNEEELFLLLGQLPSILTQRDPDYWISFRDFSQESVMKKFEEVFLFGL